LTKAGAGPPTCSSALRQSKRCVSLSRVGLLDEAGVAASGFLPEAWVACVGTLGSGEAGASEAGAGAAVVGAVGAGAAEGATAS
jgi:hypothetical protein